MQEEFQDRFGAFPEEVNNLFYYMGVKVKANAAGLSSVALEDDQIVLRFPTLPGEKRIRKLPDLKLTRAGKNAYWMEYSPSDKHWRAKLINVIDQIMEFNII
jgi:transcription-repair coupling factor (superfamily II helicase)